MCKHFTELFYDILLPEDFGQSLHPALNLFLRMRSHQGEAHQCVLRRAGRWNDGIDEHTCVKRELGHEESLVHIMHIQGDDRALGVAYFKPFLAEAAPRIVGNRPQSLYTLRLLPKDMEGLPSGGWCA